MGQHHHAILDVADRKRPDIARRLRGNRAAVHDIEVEARIQQGWHEVRVQPMPEHLNQVHAPW